MKRRKKCTHCGTEFLGGREKTLCSEACRKARAHLKGNQRPKEPNLTPGQVDAILARAVKMETAMPWERHPQAWT